MQEDVMPVKSVIGPTLCGKTRTIDTLCQQRACLRDVDCFILFTYNSC